MDIKINFGTSRSISFLDYYKFWLESINRFSDKNTPVIIVGTHAEKLSETVSMIWEKVCQYFNVSISLNKFQWKTM